MTDLAPYADYALRDAAIPELPGHYRGKVRENYDLGDGRRLIVATDRLSAFDRIITAVPLKGQVLTQIARFWFDHTADPYDTKRAGYLGLGLIAISLLIRDTAPAASAVLFWTALILNIGYGVAHFVRGRK